MKPYFLANWKMYLSYDESVALAEQVRQDVSSNGPETVVFPSALAGYRVARIMEGSSVKCGAQNVAWVEKGAYTGEVSPHMYRDAGFTHALVGHSERRHVFHETEQELRQKLEAVVGVGLTPVVCVGETVAEREAGQALSVVEAQIRRLVEGLTLPKDAPFMVAYEPVWAIASGAPCSPSDAQAVQTMLRNVLSQTVGEASVAVLYGGSVDASNVRSYIDEAGFDGVLVGSASVKRESFQALSQALAHRS